MDKLNYKNKTGLDLQSTYITEVLTDYVVCVFINKRSGLCHADLTKVYTELGDNPLKVAFTLDDSFTQLYAVLKHWDFNKKKSRYLVKIPHYHSQGTTKLFFHWDSEQPDNTTYINYPTSPIVKNVFTGSPDNKTAWLYKDNLSDLIDWTSHNNHGISFHMDSNNTVSDTIKAQSSNHRSAITRMDSLYYNFSDQLIVWEEEKEKNNNMAMESYKEKLPSELPQGSYAHDENDPDNIEMKIWGAALDGVEKMNNEILAGLASPLYANEWLIELYEKQYGYTPPVDSTLLERKIEVLKAMSTFKSGSTSTIQDIAELILGYRPNIKTSPHPFIAGKSKIGGIGKLVSRKHIFAFWIELQAALTSKPYDSTNLINELFKASPADVKNIWPYWDDELFDYSDY